MPSYSTSLSLKITMLFYVTFHFEILEHMHWPCIQSWLSVQIGFAWNLLQKCQFLPFHVQHQRKAAARGHQPSLNKVILRIYGLKMTWTGIVKLAAAFAGLIGPLCINGIVLYVSDIYYKRDNGGKVRGWESQWPKNPEPITNCQSNLVIWNQWIQ